MIMTTISICSTLLCCSPVDTTTTLRGEVLESATGEKVFYASIRLYKDKQLVSEVKTNANGMFLFPDVKLGTYQLEAQYLGLGKYKIKTVGVQPGIPPIQIIMQEKKLLRDILDFITTVGVQSIAKFIRGLLNKQLAH